MQQDADFRTLDEAAVREFERCWIRGNTEAIEAYLPEANSPLYLPTLEELVLVDMEFRWKRLGQSKTKSFSDDAPPKIEAYLHRFPPLDEPSICKRLIHEEYRVRRQFGDQPSLEEYCRRFPDLVATLQDLLSGSVSDTLHGTHPSQCTTSFQTVAPQSLESIGNYEVFEEIGRGGMGVVYRARQRRPNRIVALKMLLRNRPGVSEGLDRFRIEAEAVGQLNNPNIVQVYEAGEQDGLPFFSLEYCEGGSLAQKLGGLPQPPRAAASLVEILARAIQSAHDRGIVHRDLKPANVLFAADGTPKVTDFGLAKQIDQDGGQTHTGAVMGTPSYMAPEQALGEGKRVGPAADVYALGAILYEGLTGRPPFRGATVLETLDQVRSREPVSVRELNPAVPRDLQTICLKCLHKEPGNRYSSAAALAEDLRRFLDGETIAARPAGRFEKFGRWCRRDPYLAATGALAILALLGALVASLAYAFEQSQNASEQSLAAHRLRIEKKQTDAARERASHFTSLSARLAADRGQFFGEKGDAPLGLLWYARSLEMADPDDKDLQWFVRTNLDAWRRQVQPLKAIYPHGHRVSVAIFSPDGQFVLTGQVDGTAQLWRVATGEPIGKPMQHTQPIDLATFSKDNKRIATTSINKLEFFMRTGTTQVWDASTGEPIGPLVHHDSLSTLTLSADGKKILWNNLQRDRLQCQDVDSGRVLFDLKCSAIKVLTQVFSPDGKTIVAQGSEGEVQLLDAESGNLIKEMHPFTRGVRDAAFSPDGKMIVVCDVDGIARLLDAHTLEPFGETMVHDFIGLQIVISPDSEIVMIYGLGKFVRLWDAHTGKPYRRGKLSLDSPIGIARFSADSKTIVTTCLDQTAQIWDVASGERFGTGLHFRGRLGDLIPSSDGRALLVSIDDSSVQLREMDDRDGAGHLPCAELVKDAAFSIDGKIALTMGGSGIQRWNITTQERMGDPLGYKGGSIVHCLTISRDGKSILAGTSSGEVKWWDLETGQLLYPALSMGHDGKFRHTSPVMQVEISPDGQKILTACQDRTAYLWDKNTPDSPLKKLSQRGVFGVAFSPDGATYATASNDGKAQIWNTVTGEPIGRPLEHSDTLWRCRFSPDGRTLLTTSNFGAYLWTPATGRSVTLPYSGVSSSQAFSPDGRIVMIGTTKEDLFLYEAGTGKPIGPALRHRDEVFCGAFSPDQRTLLTGCADQKTRLWDVPQPVEGDADRIVLWTQVVTGCELDDAGELHILDQKTWESRRQRLHEMGGPPVPSVGSKTARLDNMEFSNPSGIWNGWYKNSLRTAQGMSETRSKITINWDGKNGSGDWDGYLIENMRRLTKHNGSILNSYEWTHKGGGKCYRVSIEPREVRDSQVVGVFAFYEVTDTKGIPLYDGQGYFSLQATK